MRTINLALPMMFFAVAACSQKAADQTSSPSDPDVPVIRTMDVAEQAQDASASVAPPPKISAAVAPGVAFDYRYVFGLPAGKISTA